MNPFKCRRRWWLRNEIGGEVAMRFHDDDGHYAEKARKQSEFVGKEKSDVQLNLEILEKSDAQLNL